MNLLALLFVGSLVRIFSDDLKSYIAKICVILLRVSAKRLNEKYAASFYEEWLSHLSETPELLGKLWHAISIFCWGTFAIRQELGSSETKFKSYLRFKRVFDLVLALLILPLVMPVIWIIWAISRAEGGSGFFVHERVGKDGKTFRCIKIRTMLVDADERLRSHLDKNPYANDEWLLVQKLRNDPHITPFGYFLRRTSLDEIPQIINVLKGEMSFVGPRPITLAEIEEYKQGADSYKSVKPGITGFWQVSNKLDSIDERIEMDKEYVKTASLWEDIKVIFSTIRRVLFPKD